MPLTQRSAGKWEATVSHNTDAMFHRGAGGTFPAAPGLDAAAGVDERQGRPGGLLAPELRQVPPRPLWLLFLEAGAGRGSNPALPFPPLRRGGGFPDGLKKLLCGSQKLKEVSIGEKGSSCGTGTIFKTCGADQRKEAGDRGP